MTTKTPLGEICNVEYGTRVVEKRDGGEIFPVYGGGGATFKMDAYNRESRLVVSRFGMSKECTRFVEGKFFLNDSGLTVSPLSGGLLTRFLEYQLMSLNDVIYSLGRGTAQKNLDVAAFKRINLLVVDIVEQQRIVRLLNEAFAAIDATKVNTVRNLENAREIFVSYLDSVFVDQRGKGRWKLLPLKQVCVAEKEQGHYSNLPFVGLEHIEAGTGRFIGSMEPTSVKSATFKFSAEHVLFGRLRPYLNKVLIPNFSGHCSTEIFPLRPLPGLSRKFLYYWLKADTTVKKIVATSTGARMPRANMKRVFEFGIPLPPLVEQQVIVEKLEKLFEQASHLQFTYSEKLKNIDSLRQSLLQQVFPSNL